MKKANVPNSTYFCTLPFSGAQINEFGVVTPCCNWDFNDRKGWPKLEDGGLEKAVQHPRFQEVRNNMLEQKPTSGCRKCFDNERAKSQSFRLWTLERDKEWIKESQQRNLFDKDFFEMRYLDSVFSILCNLSCRMCSSSVSSTYSKIVEPHKKVLKTPQLDLYDIDFSKLSYLKFVGGEPLMEPKHDQFIEKITQEDVDIPNLSLIYHTNATMLPNKKVQAVWKKCKSIQINLSIDGYGDINWKQRPGPYTWQDVEKVCKQYRLWAREWKNIKIRVSSVITKINVFHLHELEQWADTFWDKDMHHKDHSLFEAHCIEHPGELSICDWHDNLERKTQIKKYLQNIKRPYLRDHILYWLENVSSKTAFDYNIKSKRLDKYWKYDIDKYL